MTVPQIGRRRTDRAVTVPFGHRGSGRQVAHAALFPISVESFQINAHALFAGASHKAGIVRSQSAHPEWLGDCAINCNAQFSQMSSPKSVIFPGRNT